MRSRSPCRRMRSSSSSPMRSAWCGGSACPPPYWNLPPGSSQVSVRLTETDGGTRVRLTHDQLPGDLRAIDDEGWATFLARLSAATAGTDVPGYSPEGRP